MRNTWSFLLLILPFLTNAQPTNNTIFFGGNGDGHSQYSYAQPHIEFRKGGEGDGWNVNNFAQSHIDFRKGGIGDGWNVNNFAQSHIEFRKGGVGDGWNFDNYEQFYAEFRKGGIGDGWAHEVRPEGPLPVHMVSFQAQKIDQHSLLLWTVEQEVNVTHYEVERSTDGRHFDPIGNVQSTGLTSRQQYRFVDEHPANGINYYRLKSIDADQTYQYSAIVLLYFNATNYVAIYPNPVSHLLNVTMGNPQPATFLLIDGNGRVIMKKTFNATHTSLDVSSLPKGVYRYILFEDNTMQLRGSILIY